VIGYRKGVTIMTALPAAFPPAPTKTLHLLFFFTKDVDPGRVPAMLDAARQIYARCGFRLDVWPGAQRFAVTTLPVDRPIAYLDREAYDLRDMVAQRYPQHMPHWLPVIFGRIGAQGVGGVTKPDLGDPKPVKPFVIIDPEKSPATNAPRLAHEIGHAGGLPDDFTDATNLMFHHSDQRRDTRLSASQVRQIGSAAYFAT
jgi:hypothetical protein